MKSTLNLCVLLLGTIVINALPYNARPISSYGHKTAMMFGGYYELPKNRRSAYVPQGGMTAYANGDMVATNSYLGSVPAVPEYEVAEEQESQDKYAPQDQAPFFHEDETTDEFIKEAADTTSTSKPKKESRRKQRPQLKADEEDDDDAASAEQWPFKKTGSRGVPYYNAFFPIMFGGYSSGRERSGEQGYPGSATAIANSFSTGKGGVATSHATAYGDPYLSTLLRNGNGNGSKKRTSSDKHE